MSKQSSPLVIGVSPQSNVGPLENSLELEPSRSSVFSSDTLVVFWFIQSLLLEYGDLFLGSSEFLRVEPFLVPITTSHSLPGSSTDSLEHEFSRVGIVRYRGTVSLEVVDEDIRVFADITKVDTLSTSL